MLTTYTRSTGMQYVYQIEYDELGFVIRRDGKYKKSFTATLSGRTAEGMRRLHLEAAKTAIEHLADMTE